MASTLEEDLKSLSEWAEALAGHHHNGLAREALMHGRNLGEAACRIIIRVAWPGKRGEDELRAPQFDQLLRTIQNKALAPPEIVSALHVLRTRGNNALHGKPVSTNDSAGALYMLRALLDHLYLGLLHRRIPASVARAMDQAMDGKAEPERRDALRDMLRDVLREETKSAAQPEPPVPATDPVDVRHLEAEQEDQRARIRDMEELVKQLASREVQVSMPPPAPEIASEAPAPSRRSRWPFFAAVLSLVVVAVMLVTLPWNAANDKVVSPVPDSTVTTVVIVPLALMQDDPNLSLRFEQAIEERLKARIREGKLAMRVFLADTTISAVPPEDGVLSIARRHHADVIFYGELFEPTSSDSGRAHIRFISVGEGNTLKGDLGPLGFRTLADSGAIHVQRSVQGIAELALAHRLYRTGKPSAALAVLYQVPPVNTEWTVATHLLRARCHYLMEDLAPAMREIEAGLALAPDNAETLANMGSVLKDNGNYAAAIGFYERAITHDPHNAPWLVDLARLVGDGARPETFDEGRHRAFTLRALEVDSTCADAWSLYGVILANDGNTLAARSALERAVELDSTHAIAMLDLAMLLLHRIQPPDEHKAEILLRKAVRLDSSNSAAVLLLAKVLLQGPGRDPVLAERLFRRANATNPQLELQALAGRAKVAYNARNDAQALDLYKQFWARDSSEIAVGVRIAVLLQNMGRGPAATAMLLRCYALDSMHHRVNLNLGITYLEPGTAPERKKAIKHLERALGSDPQDQKVLEQLGMALAEDLQYGPARHILERLLMVDPNNHLGNGYLGSVMEQLGFTQQAVQYYEKALGSDPGDPLICRNLAALYTNMEPSRNAEARLLLQRALKEVPDDPSMHMSMCSVLMQEGEYHRAAEHYRRAIAIKPKLRNAMVERKLADQGVW